MAPKAKTGANKRCSDDKLPVDLIKKLKSKLQYATSKGDEHALEIKDKYDNGDHETKKQILAKYAEDPSLKWAFELEISVAESESTDNQTQKAWYTRVQLARMENLDDEKPSDKELLDQLCSSLPQRTHEDKCWAEMGILQYQRQEKRSLESEKVQVTTTTSQSLRGRAAPPKKEKSNKVEKAEGVDLQVSWTVAVKKAVSDGPHVCIVLV